MVKKRNVYHDLLLNHPFGEIRQLFGICTEAQNVVIDQVLSTLTYLVLQNNFGKKLTEKTFCDIVKIC